MDDDDEKDPGAQVEQRPLSFLTGDAAPGDEAEPVLDVPPISMLPEAPPPAPPGPRRGGSALEGSPLDELGASVRRLADAVRAHRAEVDELRRMLNALD